jgi:hypothetical protein
MKDIDASAGIGFVIIALALSVTYNGLILDSQFLLQRFIADETNDLSSAQVHPSPVGYTRLLVYRQIHEGMTIPSC